MCSLPVVCLSVCCCSLRSAPDRGEEAAYCGHHAPQPALPGILPVLNNPPLHLLHDLRHKNSQQSDSTRRRATSHGSPALSLALHLMAPRLLRTSLILSYRITLHCLAFYKICCEQDKKVTETTT